MNNYEFGKYALEMMSSEVGVITIVSIVIFSTIVTKFISKTVNINQKQSFIFLSMMFIGLLVFFVFIIIEFNNTTKSVKKDDINHSVDKTTIVTKVIKSEEDNISIKNKAKNSKSNIKTELNNTKRSNINIVNEIN